MPIVPGTPGALGPGVLRLAETGSEQGLGPKQSKKLVEVFATVNPRKLRSAIQNLVKVSYVSLRYFKLGVCGIM